MKLFKPGTAVLLSGFITFASLPAAGDSIVSPVPVTIPNRLGFVSETWFPSGENSAAPPNIIFVQDLHVNRSVQFAISGILKQLHRLNLLPRQIAVEGAAGPINATSMQTYPDEKIRSAAADYLVKQGEMSGSMHFVVTEGHGELVGVETEEVYAENLNIFRSTYEQRIRVKEELQNLSNVLPRLRHDPALKEKADLLARDIKIVMRLVNLQALPNELQPTFIDVVRSMGRLKQILPQDVGYLLFNTLSESAKFYALVMMRNEDIFQNMLVLRHETGQTTTVLIAGGFHTKAITEECKARGLSYVVVTPTVRVHNATDERLYTERLLGHHLTPSQIAQGLDWAAMSELQVPYETDKLFPSAITAVRVPPHAFVPSLIHSFVLSEMNGSFVPQSASLSKSERSGIRTSAVFFLKSMSFFGAVILSLAAQDTFLPLIKSAPLSLDPSEGLSSIFQSQSALTSTSIWALGLMIITAILFHLVITKRRDKKSTLALAVMLLASAFAMYKASDFLFKWVTRGADYVGMFPKTITNKFDITTAIRNQDITLNLIDIDEVRITFSKAEENMSWVVILHSEQSALPMQIEQGTVDSNLIAVVPVSDKGYSRDVLRRSRLEIKVNGRNLAKGDSVQAVGRKRISPLFSGQVEEDTQPFLPKSGIRTEHNVSQTPTTQEKLFSMNEQLFSANTNITEHTLVKTISAIGVLLAGILGMSHLLVRHVLQAGPLTAANFQDSAAVSMASLTPTPTTMMGFIAFIATLAAYFFARRMMHIQQLHFAAEVFKPKIIALIPEPPASDILARIRVLFNSSLIEIPLSKGAEDRYRRQMQSFASIALKGSA